MSLVVTDGTGKVISNPTTRVNITGTGGVSGGIVSQFSVDIDSNKLIVKPGEAIDFSIYAIKTPGNITELEYLWDFGDGTTSNNKNTKISHTYSIP